MTALQSYYIQQFSPWLVMGILVLFGLVYGIAYVNIGFQPLCLYRNRDYKKKPLQRSELIYPIVALLVFNLLTMGVCVSGAIYSQNVPLYVQEMQCQLATGMHKTLNGYSSPPATFQGLHSLNTQFKKVKDDIQGTVDLL